MTKPSRITILGGGAWGTALAATVCRAGADVILWVREPEVARSINQHHENPGFLPGIALDPTIRAMTDLSESVASADIVLLVVPAQYLRAVVGDLAGSIRPATPILCATKGIEIATGATMGEVVVAELPSHPFAVLSGPTFAIEVAQGLPTALTLACRDLSLGERLVQAVGTASFRPYLSDDPVGSEIGGAVKNVLAIACGIVTGRGLGDNARAALITRGLAEMVRLAVAKGGKPATLMGLSGLGDLTLTCTAMQSRNYSLGAALGSGQLLDAVLGSRRSVAEGVTTAAAVVALARSLGIDMPISTAVDAILHHGASIDDEIRRLLGRKFTTEQLVP